MSTKVNEREQDRNQKSRNMSDLKPGRSAMPPAFGLTASEPGATGGNLLSASIGRKGENKPKDLIRFGKYLQSIGAPPSLIAEGVDPSRNGDLIAKYQRQVLKFRNPDGRMDPGGKTETAVREQRGRDIVAGWYKKPKSGSSDKAGKGPSGKDVQIKGGEIPPVLSTSQYFSQYNQGAPCVPLSLLKANLKKKSSERAYRNVGCYQTCRHMLLEAGFSPGSRSDSEYLLNMETKGKDKGWNKSIGGLSQNFASSISKLDESLLKGIPVIVGVNKSTKNFDWTNTKPDGSVSPTDHFVVIVGKTINAEGHAAYRFFDPARYSLSNGTSSKNLLVQGETGQFTGNPYKSHNYSLSEIRATQ